MCGVRCVSASVYMGHWTEPEPPGTYRARYIEGGSLLGLVRHGGRQIPWDNDADIHILINRTAPFSLRREDYIQRLLRFNDYESPFSLEKCYQPNPPNGICTTAFKLHEGRMVGSNDLFGLGSVLVDITPVVDMMDGNNRIWSGWDGWKKAKMRVEEIYPLTKCMYYDIEVDCPRDSLAFLRRMYGKDVLKKSVQDVNFWAVGLKKKT